jgi:hypothetical protein
MDSPLSFNSSENFRKRLLTRNLKPYRVDGTSFGESFQNKEFQIVDYSVKDSEEISKIGDIQEKDLYKQNKYGPDNSNSTYGDMVNINVNLNVETNFGLYGFKNSINSKLEKIGDGQEKLLYVNNIYGPTEFETSYGNTIEINKNLQTETNKGKYGYPLTVGSDLEKIGDTKEKEFETLKSKLKDVSQKLFENTTEELLLEKKSLEDKIISLGKAINESKIETSDLKKVQYSLGVHIRGVPYWHTWCPNSSCPGNRVPLTAVDKNDEFWKTDAGIKAADIFNKKYGIQLFTSQSAEDEGDRKSVV